MILCLPLTQPLPSSDTIHVGRMKSNVAKGSSTINQWKCVVFLLLGKLDTINLEQERDPGGFSSGL